VFFLAGVAKLADRKGAAKAFNDFGVSPALAGPLSLLFSLAEIAVAVALIPLACAWYGACAVLALLSIFSIGIAVNLARGRNPDCHCFGQLHSSPVGRSTLIRNGILGGVAGWLVLRGLMRDGPSLWSHLASASDNERRLFVVAACLMCFLLLRALRRKEATESDDVAREPLVSEQRALRETNVQYPDSALRKVLEEGMGWPIGTQAPEFALPDITGQKCSLQSLRGKGKTICLVFSSPYCEPCKALWPSLGRWTREYDQALNMIIISRGSTTENSARQNNIEASRVLLQQEFELSDAYGVTATPAAVLVGVDGSIQSRLAVGREDIQQLISSAAKLSTGQISPTQDAGATPQSA
jgi:peroxiredoxin